MRVTRVRMGVREVGGTRMGVGVSMSMSGGGDEALHAGGKRVNVDGRARRERVIALRRRTGTGDLHGEGTHAGLMVRSGRLGVGGTRGGSRARKEFVGGGSTGVLAVMGGREVKGVEGKESVVI